MKIDSGYRAFLSYSHADTKWARWLHRRLEGFRLRELAGRDGARGPVPPRLAPIFRDREEFTAGHSLSDQTLAALEASEALIVLCSPAAAGSRYVNEEIRLFKTRHPGRLVVPVIADGKPGDPERECFPPALRFKVGADGAVTSEHEPDFIAADLRETGDGSELALAKTVAALVGLPPDQVYQRAERERRRQVRIRAAVAAAFVLLSGTGGFFLWRSQQQGVVLLDTAAACARYMPADSSPSDSPLDTLDRCIKSLEALRLGAASDPRDAAIVKLIAEGKTDEAERLQLEAAQDDEAAGLARTKNAAKRHRTIADTAGLSDPRKAREHYAKAVRLDPEDIGGMFLYGQAELQGGNLDAAEKAYEAVIRLSAQDPYLYQFDVYHSHRGLGLINQAKGKLDGAREHYELALRDAKRLADQFSGAAPFERGLSLSYASLGGVLQEQGDLDGALQAYREALAGAQRLASPSSTDRSLSNHLATSYNHVAGVLAAKRQFSEATETYRQSIAISERLANAHPDDVFVQTTLSAAYRGAAMALLSLGHKDEALKLSLDALTIKHRFAVLDPDNRFRRLDLAYGHIDVGDVMLALGRNAEARKAYHDGLSVLEQVPPNPTDLITQLATANALWSIARLSSDPRADGARAVAILEKLHSDGRLSPASKLWLDGIKTALARAEVRVDIQQGSAAAQAASARQEHAAAFELVRPLIEAMEKLETEARGAPGTETAAILGQLSWYALFARRFDDALAASERGLELGPALTWIATNRAHALMFLQRPEDARAVYLAHRGKRLPENGNKLWEEVISEDFAEFAKVDLAHPQMAEIRKLLGSTGELADPR